MSIGAIRTCSMVPTSFSRTIDSAVEMTAVIISDVGDQPRDEEQRAAQLGTFPFVVGKSIPYFLISLASAALIILAAMLLFGLPMRGNWISLLIALSLFIVGALGTVLVHLDRRGRAQQVALERRCYRGSLDADALGFHLSNLDSLAHRAPRPWPTWFPARYFLMACAASSSRAGALWLLWPQMLALSVLRAISARAGVRAHYARESSTEMQRLRCLCGGFSGASAETAALRPRHHRAENHTS